MARKLRPVQPGERAVNPKRLSVVEAAADRTRRKLLVALQGRIAKAVESDWTAV
jgi:hypothetical protein